jgi:hypothetical protein
MARQTDRQTDRQTAWRLRERADVGRKLEWLEHTCWSTPAGAWRVRAAKKGIFYVTAPFGPGSLKRAEPNGRYSNLHISLFTFPLESLPLRRGINRSISEKARLVEYVHRPRKNFTGPKLEEQSGCWLVRQDKLPGLRDASHTDPCLDLTRPPRVSRRGSTRASQRHGRYRSAWPCRRRRTSGQAARLACRALPSICICICSFAPSSVQYGHYCMRHARA